MVNIINSLRMRDIRKDNDMTQDEIAKILNIKKDKYSKYENSGTLPSLEIIYNFSKYFGLNIDYVLGLTNKRLRADYDSYSNDLVASNLKQLRLSKGFSQSGLARKLGITQSAIYRYENCLSNPSLNVIYSYCKMFNVSFHSLCISILQS